VGPNGVTPPPENGKRKASPFDGADGQPAEKRAKRDPDADADEPMAIDCMYAIAQFFLACSEFIHEN
jgi:hypothetical protein